MLSVPLHIEVNSSQIHSILLSPSQKFIIISKDFSIEILNYPELKMFKFIENLDSPSIFCFSEDEKVLVSSDSNAITARNLNSLEILFQINPKRFTWDVATFNNKLLITRDGFIDVYEWNGEFVQTLVVNEQTSAKKIVIFDKEHFIIMTRSEISIFKNFEIVHKIEISSYSSTVLTKLSEDLIAYSNIKSSIIIFNVKKLENVAKLNKIINKKELHQNPTFGLFTFGEFLIEMNAKFLHLWNWKMEMEIQTLEINSSCIEISNEGRIFSGNDSQLTTMRIFKCDIQNEHFQDVVFEFED
jgi:WD40 repeat protein